ncbi:MAG TPA: transglutaminase-like domain-containing protein [Caulobacteraceae bacterium]|nr:transglutaminase-like domain-containing protein [Caulobacteraceae bacterium]
MPLPREIEAFYTTPGPMTALGPHAAAVAALPRDLAGVCGAVQGDMVHFHWAEAYGLTMPPERGAQQHLRTVRASLDVLGAGAPLDRRREPNDRVVGVCRHFAVLTTAILRAQGVPARSRTGFGAYFEAGKFVDHWVVEYWNREQERWVLVDSQLDALQAAALKLDFDPKDTPRDRFIIAGDAWKQCRAGKADPMAFGIFDMWGLWFIGGNVVRDAASLNNMEMLPWDVWGATPQPTPPLDADALAFIDRLADLTMDADARFDELRAVYEQDARLRVPREVFNALTSRSEPVVEAIAA